MDLNLFVSIVVYIFLEQLHSLLSELSNLTSKCTVINWGPQFPAENLAKFHRPVCKIPWLTTENCLNFAAHYCLLSLG